MTNKEKTLADQYFQADEALDEIKSKIRAALVKQFDKWTYHGLTFSVDEYEKSSGKSIELFGFDLHDHRDKLLTVCLEMGFKKAWIHRAVCGPPKGANCRCKPVPLEISKINK